jgi:hypothetical protein
LEPLQIRLNYTLQEEKDVFNLKQLLISRMPSSGMLRHVGLVGTDVSKECSASITKVTKIGKLRTTLAASSNRRTLQRNTVPSSPILVILMMEALSSSATSVLT